MDFKESSENADTTTNSKIYCERCEALNKAKEKKKMDVQRRIDAQNLLLREIRAIRDRAYSLLSSEEIQELKDLSIALREIENAEKNETSTHTYYL